MSAVLLTVAGGVFVLLGLVALVLAYGFTEGVERGSLSRLGFVMCFVGVVAIALASFGQLPEVDASVRSPEAVYLDALEDAAARARVGCRACGGYCDGPRRAAR